MAPRREILEPLQRAAPDAGPTLEFQPGNVVLVATDGLTSVVTDCEIVDVLDEHRDIDVAVGSLIDMANARGGPDNITVAIVRWAA